MSEKFTKGPWGVFLAENGNLLGVGEVENSEGVTDGHVGIWRDGPEQLANAHLIAAAPDMFEALEAIVAHFDLNGNSEENPNDAMHEALHIAPARAALSKASGEPNGKA